MTDSTYDAHPTPKMYWTIALVLAVITAVEVAIPYIDTFDPITVPALLLLGAAKFMIVVGFFMHLRFDKIIYRNLFFIGVVGALIIFAVVLAAMQAF